MMLSRSSNDIVADDERNVIVVQLAEYGDVREVSDDGHTRYRETFQSMKMADRVAAKDAHGGSIIGHADVQSFRDKPNPTVDLHIADTTAGRDLMALVRNGTVDSVSVEFVPSENDLGDDGVVVRNDSLISGVAFAFRPAHQAPILATREDNTPQTKETNMADTATPDIAADAVTREDLAAVRDELTRELVNFRTIDTGPVNPLAKYRSKGELYHAIVHGEPGEIENLNRALSDQILTANDGVNRLQYIDQIKGIVDFGRPLINAFGVDAWQTGQGNTVEWPITGVDNGLVGVQAVEKTEVTSKTWIVTNATATIKTYAGASDVSWQIIKNSSPSYLDALLAAYYRDYAAKTDAGASTELMAAAVPGPEWSPATGTADQLRVALFEASLAVETATGSPASFVLAGSGAYLKMGGLAGLWPYPYGTQNVSGTADAGSLMVNVSGLPVKHCRHLGDTEIVVSNSQTAKWREISPMVVTAENVALAGRDVGIFGMGILTPFVPSGIVEILPVAP